MKTFPTANHGATVTQLSETHCLPTRTQPQAMLAAQAAVHAQFSGFSEATDPLAEKLPPECVREFGQASYARQIRIGEIVALTAANTAFENAAKYETARVFSIVTEAELGLAVDSFARLSALEFGVGKLSERIATLRAEIAEIEKEALAFCKKNAQAAKPEAPGKLKSAVEILGE